MDDPIEDVPIVEGETAQVQLYADYVIKKQVNYLDYDLISNEYDKLMRLSRFSHFPTPLSMPVDNYLILNHCGDHLDRNNLPFNWKEQLKDIECFLVRENIIHRDIRPENIMVDKGFIYLIDFGWSVFKDGLLFGPDSIGDKFKHPEKWDDAYSMRKVIEHYEL